MGELGKELGLLVVLEVDVARGELKLEARERGSGANLAQKNGQEVSFGDPWSRKAG